MIYYAATLDTVHRVHIKIDISTMSTSRIDSILDNMYDWAWINCQSLVRFSIDTPYMVFYTDNYNSKIAVYSFEDPSDAVLFDLTWG